MRERKSKAELIALIRQAVPQCADADFSITLGDRLGSNWTVIHVGDGADLHPCFEGIEQAARRLQAKFDVDGT